MGSPGEQRSCFRPASVASQFQFDVVLGTGGFPLKMTRPPPGLTERDPIEAKALDPAQREVLDAIISKIGMSVLQPIGEIYIEGLGMGTMYDPSPYPPQLNESSLTVADVEANLRDHSFLAYAVDDQSGRDLLRTVIDTMDPLHPQKSDILKCLISANPRSLISPKLPSNIEPTSVRAIARMYPELLAWIAKHHTWVLHDATSGLLDRGSSLNCLPAAYVEGRLEATDIQTFYDRFPAGLSLLESVDPTAHHPGFPLQIMLHRLFGNENWNESDEECIKFLVKKDPNIVRQMGLRNSLLSDISLNTITFQLCRIYNDALASHRAGMQEDQKIEVAKVQSACRIMDLFVSTHPEFLSEASNGDMNIDDINRPLYWNLLALIHEPLIQELVIRMMKIDVDCFEFVRRDPAIEMDVPQFCDDIRVFLGEKAKCRRELLRLEVAVGSRLKAELVTDHEGPGEEHDDVSASSSKSKAMDRDDGSQTLGEYTGTLYLAWVQEKARAIHGALKDVEKKMEEKKRKCCQESYFPVLLS